jgi:hypothetical protein
VSLVRVAFTPAPGFVAPLKDCPRTPRRVHGMA